MDILNYFFTYKDNLPDDILCIDPWVKYAVTLVVLFILFYPITRIYKKHDEKTRRHIMLILAVIMLFMMPVAILTDNQLLKTLSYAMGFPGALFAYIYPTIIAYPFISFEYFRYMLSHYLLVIVPLLWVTGDAFRPETKHFKWVLLATTCNAFFMLGLNALVGSNYMYVSRMPEHVNINLPQPWFFLAMLALMLVVVALTMLPFMRKRKSSQTL